ncbi:hypothetical protein ABFS83_03G107400 [Erythranthe nasuta]
MEFPNNRTALVVKEIVPSSIPYNTWHRSKPESELDLIISDTVMQSTDEEMIQELESDDHFFIANKLPKKRKVTFLRILMAVVVLFMISLSVLDIEESGLFILFLLSIYTMFSLVITFGKTLWLKIELIVSIMEVVEKLWTVAILLKTYFGL